MKNLDEIMEKELSRLLIELQWRNEGQLRLYILRELNDLTVRGYNTQKYYDRYHQIQEKRVIR